MDDATDGVTSRAPEVEDLLALCRSLNREGARYVLIGGFAVVLHGFVRTTKDVDLLVEASAENLSALKRALADLPDNAIAEVDAGDLERYSVVRVADEIVIDLMATACGVDYAEAIRLGVEPREVEGVVIPLASRRLLIRTKDTVRPSDAMDVAFLRAVGP
jgi:hypothetical protein